MYNGVQNTITSYKNRYLADEGQQATPPAEQPSPVTAPESVPGENAEEPLEDEEEKVKEEEEEPVEATKECKPELLVSYGFSSRTESLGRNLRMCPQVMNSCCSIEDQLNIYQNWEYSREKELLEERFDWHREIYFDLLEELLKVKEKADNLMEKLKKKKVSNCQILARRITQIQIQVVAPQLKDQLHRLHQFFEQTYQGFYCTICDADMHAFVDIQGKTMQYSEEFCRQIVVNALHPMLYLHDYFTKYLNLVTKFLYSCDFEGNFKEKPIPPKLIFHAELKYHNSLNKCNKHRNFVDWFDSCNGICQEFNPVKVNRKFWAPHLKKISRYNEFVKEHLKIWEEKRKTKEEERNSRRRILATKSVQKKSDSFFQKQQRYLANDQTTLESIDPRKVFETNKFKKFSDDAIFRSGINAIIFIDEFKKKFMFQGINFYKTGKASIITRDMFDVVKTQLKADQQQTLRNLLDARTLVTKSSVILGLLSTVFLLLNQF